MTPYLRLSSILDLLVFSASISSGLAYPRFAGTELFAREDQKSLCPNKEWKTCGLGLPPEFCCPKEGSTCIAIAGKSTAVCCPGDSCGRLQRVPCSLDVQDVSKNPNAIIMTTVLDGKLPQCGDQCCPYGYACGDCHVDGKDFQCCLIEANQDKRPESGGGGNNPTSTSSSAGPTSTGAIPPGSNTDPATTPTTVPDDDPDPEGAEKGGNAQSATGPTPTAILLGALFGTLIAFVGAFIAFFGFWRRRHSEREDSSLRAFLGAIRNRICCGGRKRGGEKRGDGKRGGGSGDSSSSGSGSGSSIESGDESSGSGGVGVGGNEMPMTGGPESDRHYPADQDYAPANYHQQKEGGGESLVTPDYPPPGYGAEQRHTMQTLRSQGDDREYYIPIAYSSPSMGIQPGSMMGMMNNNNNNAVGERRMSRSLRGSRYRSDMPTGMGMGMGMTTGATSPTKPPPAWMHQDQDWADDRPGYRNLTHGSGDYGRSIMQQQQQQPPTPGQTILPPLAYRADGRPPSETLNSSMWPPDSDDNSGGTTLPAKQFVPYRKSLSPGLPADKK